MPVGHQKHAKCQLELDQPHLMVATGRTLMETDLDDADRPRQSTEGFPLCLEQEELEAKREGGIKGEPTKELIPVQMHQTNPTKTIRVGALLHEEAQKNFKAFLQNNVDIFAWSYEDMPSIYSAIIAHYLNVDPQYKPVKQK